MLSNKIKTLGFTVIFIGLIFTAKNFFKSEDKIEETEVAQEEVKEPKRIYGFSVDSFDIQQGQIQPNEFLSDLLIKHNLTYAEIENAVKNASEVFDVRKIMAGKNYAIVCSKDSIGKAKCFIYEPNETEYIVFNFGENDSVYKEERDVLVEERVISGAITSSLYETLMQVNASPALAMKLSEIFAWTIDFYRIQKDDYFKVIYDEQSVEGKIIGVGQVKAVVFNHNGNDYYAYRFEHDGKVDYYDDKGNSQRKQFLKAPLKFSRISSRYTLNRYHPVQKRNKPHFGTDYAAPQGTPIMAVGDGTVLEAKYSKFNGNYVKIKHNGTYTTQYLHMSKIASGMKSGKRVQQGEVIGYVGSTGLATGPHVCFRFWKNGKQVDHLKEKFPTSEPIEEKYRAQFNQVRDQMDVKLSDIKTPV